MIIWFFLEPVNRGESIKNRQSHNNIDAQTSVLKVLVCSAAYLIGAF